jgi:hypothetical protein
MSKFLTLWEVDNSRWPSDPKERATLIGKQLEMTKKLLDEGQISDWGVFAGGGAGYSIGEGTEADTLKRTMQFAPYIRFKVHPVLSVAEAAGIIKSMME